MKQWLETRQVLDRLTELQRAGQRAALATVVRVRGSAYRHEGAKMIVADDGATCGNVSGGCLEADVREVALQVLASGVRTRREYCGSADEIAAWDLGVGCEGMVDVLVERVEASHVAALNVAREALRAHAPFVVCSDLETGERGTVTGTHTPDSLTPAVADRAKRLIESGASGIHTVNGRDVFFDVFTPPPKLVIASAGEDARHLAKCAADVGFRVVVVDRRPGLLVADRFPADTTLVDATPSDVTDHVSFDDSTYAVIMNHNYADDREFLRAILGTACPYIGMLGPRQRTERMIVELAAADPVDETRVYGPVGLDIGTDGAEQVAVAVIAEVLAVRSGRRPASLRERRRPIHVSAVV